MRQILLSLAVLLATVNVHAGNTQVSADSYKAAGKTGHYWGRADGLYHDTTSKGLRVIGNGTPGGVVGKSYYEDFSVYGDDDGLSCLDMDGAGVCAGNAALAPCQCVVGSGLRMLITPLVVQTLAPDMDATGIDIGMDQTADDGVEVLFGVTGASGSTFVIGYDPAFYACATLTISDVSGSDDLHFGFRELEAMTATFDNYTDLATIGSISGDIYIETILNNAATTSTDTTDNWADAASKKLCVLVSAAGVVTYTVDGVAPTATAAYTFADGLSVVPFIHYLQDADLTDVIIQKIEVGYQE